MVKFYFFCTFTSNISKKYPHLNFENKILIIQEQGDFIMKQKQKRTSDIYFISILKVTITFILIMCILTITILISSFTKTSFNNTLSKIEYIYRNLEFYFTSADNFSKTLSSDSIIQDNISFYNDAPNNFEYIKALVKVKTQRRIHEYRTIIFI